MQIIYDEYNKVTWPCSNCTILEESLDNTCDKEKCIYPRAYCASKEQHATSKKENIMEERKFEVLQGNTRLAADMRLEDALLFINAIFDKYYNEHSMVISIKEMEKLNEELS